MPFSGIVSYWKFDPEKLKANPPLAFKVPITEQPEFAIDPPVIVNADALAPLAAYVALEFDDNLVGTV